MKESYENIRKLLEQFLSEQEAGQMTDDIRQADALLSSVPAAGISQGTLEAIQEKVHRRLAVRRAHTLHQRYFSAVAAMILIAVLSFVFFIENNPGHLTTLAAMDWNDDLTVDTKLANQFDQLTGQMDKLNQTATQWLEGNSNLSAEIDSLETIAANTDFWKG
jgi:hypothetical protein